MNIVKSIEEMFFANGRYWGSLNASLYRRGLIWAMHTGIKSADLNMVWNEVPLTAADKSDIQDVKSFFRKAGLPFWWWVFPGAQPQLTGAVLQEEGFSFLFDIPCMIADVTAPTGCRSAGLQVLPVSNTEELSKWEDVSFTGFDFPAETRRQYQQFVGAFNIDTGSPQKFFLGLWDGKPVATSLLFLQGNAGGIYFVSTLRSYRKKGIGLALTVATMQYARQAGARFVSLQSSPDGLRVYQQAGFKEYCRVHVYSLTAF